MRKVLENYGVIFIGIIILIITFLIGTPVNQENVLIINIVVNVISLVYYSLNNIVGKRKIITNKIDVILIILVISSIIPLIFRTYASLNDTIYTFLKLISILNIYFIVKSECKRDANNINILINFLILSILVLCVIGLDGINNNILRDFKTSINYTRVEYDENRILSLFSYPNTIAILSGLGIFLSLDRVRKNKSNLLKIIYGLGILIMLVTLFLTYSRLVYIVFFSMIFLYLFYLLYITKFRKSSIKVKIRILVIVLTALLILAIYILIGLKIEKMLVVKDGYQKIFYSVNPDYDYNFTLNVKSDRLKIKIIEKNKFFDDVNIIEEEYLELSDENIELNFHTSDTTSVIYLNIENKNLSSETTINSCLVNNKKVILNYMILPTNVVNKVESISFENKSVWERFVFLKDSLKLIKQNPIFGYGGEAWDTLQYKVQDYNYYAKECHCFLLQIFLEFGIVGVLCCLYIICIFIKEGYKNIRKNNKEAIELFFAILILVLHSLLDFNLSYMYICIVLVILIALVFKYDENLNLKMEKIYKILIIVLTIISLVLSMIKQSYNLNKVRILRSTYEEKYNIISYYVRIMPFDLEINQEFINLYQSNNIIKEEVSKIYKSIILNEKYSKENIELDNMLEYIKLNQNNLSDIDYDKIYSLICDSSGIRKYSPDVIIKRWSNLKEIIEIISDYNVKEILKNQLKEELKLYKESILDYQKGRYNKEMVIYYLNQVEYFESFVNI